MFVCLFFCSVWFLHVLGKTPLFFVVFLVSQWFSNMLEESQRGGYSGEWGMGGGSLQNNE